jgi:hypothetical protein
MAKNKQLPSTQQHLDIQDVRDSIVVLKNGAAAAVLQTTAVNFDLLSESEQDSMIFAFAALLNSLSFPVQILVRTKRMDVSNYLYRIAEAKRRATNQTLISHIERYEAFIKDLVSKNQVLNKRFYIVIPYIGIDIAQIKTGAANFFRRNPPNVSQWTTLEKAKVNLEPKVEHLIKQLSRIGVKSIRLNTEELVELYYDVYNPEVSREQKAALGTKEYTTPIVEPEVSPVVKPSGRKENETT